MGRQYNQSKFILTKELTPETVKIKQFIINLSKTKSIKYMIDLHGHGKKYKAYDLDWTLSFSHVRGMKNRISVCFRWQWKKSSLGLIYMAALMA